MNQKFTIFDYTYILLVTIFGIIIRGYGYGIGDQVLHIPALNKLVDNLFFINDPIFPLILSHRTFIYDVLLMLSKFFQGNLFIPYILIYAISLYLFHFGIFWLAQVLFKDKKISIIANLFFIYPLPVGGAAITTVERVFVPRVLSNSLSLLTLIYAIKQNWRLSLLLFALLFIIHPLTGVSFGIILGVLIAIYWRKTDKSQLVQGIGASLLVAGVYILGSFDSLAQVSTTLFPTKAWLDVLRFRNSYAFPDQWATLSYVYLFLSLIPLVFYLYKNKQVKGDKYRWVWWILTTAVSVFVIQILFTSVWPIMPVIQLQLGRIWYYPVLISILTVCWFLVRLLENWSSRWLMVFVLLLLVVLTSANKRILVTQSSDWIDAQIWARENTGKGCIFLTDFYSQGFRVYSNRPIVGEYKDGTLAFYSEWFAYDWEKKRGFFDPGANARYRYMLHELHAKHPFSFIVLHNSLDYDASPVYTNESYSIYQWPKLNAGCTY